MPAPNEPLRAPYPNVVIPGFPRIACHVATFSKTGGTPALVAAKSSSGVNVADLANGITITFPGGGTGAVGWVVQGLTGASAVQATDSRFSIDTDLDDYAAGSVGLLQFSTDGDDTTTARDTDVAECTLLIFVLLGPGGAV